MSIRYQTLTHSLSLTFYRITGGIKKGFLIAAKAKLSNGGGRGG